MTSHGGILSQKVLTTDTKFSNIWNAWTNVIIYNFKALLLTMLQSALQEKMKPDKEDRSKKRT